MASEPTEEAIANFVSFTSTSREQAISFLKVSIESRTCSHFTRPSIILHYTSRANYII